MKSRDTYIMEMKQQLDQLNASMCALESRTKEVMQNISDDYAVELAKLRLQSTSANEKFEELKASGEERWKDLVEETEKLRDAFVHTFHYFKTQI